MERTGTSEHEGKKNQNMKTLGHRVWSEESQTHVKSRLPGWDVCKRSDNMIINRRLIIK